MPNVHRQMQIGFLVMPLALGAQLLGMLLVAAYLGPSRFGVFAVIFAIMNVANFVSEMGLGTIVTKLVAEGKRPPGHYVAVALPVVGAACLLAAIGQVVIVYAAYPAGDARWAGVLAAVNIVVFGLSMVLSSTIRGLGKMGRWMTGFLGQKVLFVAFVAVGLGLAGGGLITSLAAWTAASALMTLYYLAALWGDGWRGRLAWNYTEVRSLIRESIPVGLISAANQFGMQLDTFVLALLLGPHEVGLYALGQRLINPARNVLHGAISTPTFPGLCRLALQDRQEFDRQAGRLCVVQWVSGLPVAVVGFVAAAVLVPRLLSDYSDSVQVVWITVWALAPACLTLQMRYIYTAMSAQGHYLALNGIHLLLKTTVLMALTWRFGMLGACYGTVLAELLFVLLTRYGAWRLRLHLRTFAGIAGPSLAAAALVGLLWMIGLTHWVSLTFTAVALPVAAAYVNRLLRGAQRLRPPGEVGEQDSAGSPSPGMDAAAVP